METVTSLKPIIAIALSFFCPILIIVSYKKPNLRESWTFVIAFIKFAIIASMLPAVLAGQQGGHFDVRDGSPL